MASQMKKAPTAIMMRFPTVAFANAVYVRNSWKFCKINCPRSIVLADCHEDGAFHH